MHRLALSSALLVASKAAFASPAAFDALLEEHWAWYLAGNPVQATILGERAHDARLNDLSLAAMDRRAAEADGLLQRLTAIDRATLDPQRQVSADVLARLLARQVEANSFPARARLFTNREGFHTGFATMPERLPFFTAADYQSYLARLEAFSAQMDQAIATSRQTVKDGWTLPCAVLDGFEGSVRRVVEPGEQSRFMRPFAQRPQAIAVSEWAAMRARAQRAVERGVNPAYSRFADFLKSEYLPACRKEVGISALPGGREFYAWRARQETTTDLTPDQIHDIGLREVARIRTEMEAVARTAGFDSREAYIQHLRTDPQYYATTPGELMREVALQTRIADGWMPRLFGRLPRLPYTIREIPAETAPYTTTAYYSSGSFASGTPGVYFVNTSKLNERPLFEVPALSIHEAVPGHHHQIALAQELDLPPFRRHAAFFTGFVEGWGLYSERLGIEMGMYDTPAKDMGRLSYEMWRATRLVVDTGLHHKGWSRQQAVDYMLDNTALSRANIEAEVNRYIAWPGQALAYKIGELKIRELREAAEKALGSRFDIRAFHDKLLESGSIPLDVLDTKMRAWIAEEQARS
jgi:uncharacterized protein (DUF885 family)